MCLMELQVTSASLCVSLACIHKREFLSAPVTVCFLAYPAAVVKIQAAIRGFLGRKRAWREYFSRLALEHAGAKEVCTCK